MTFTYFGKRCVSSSDFISETIKENITLSLCLMIKKVELCLIENSRLLNSQEPLENSKVFICFCLLSFGISWNLGAILRETLFAAFTSKWQIFNDPWAGEARKFLLPMWNYKKKAGDIFFFLLIAFPGSQGKQKDYTHKNENCQRLLLRYRHFSFSKVPYKSIIPHKLQVTRNSAMTIF